MCASIIKSITHINPAFASDILGFAIGILDTAHQQFSHQFTDLCCLAMGIIHECFKTKKQLVLES